MLATMLSFHRGFGWRTVDSEVPECRTGSSLDFDVGALKEEEDGFKRITIDLAYIYSWSQCQVSAACVKKKSYRAR